MEKEMNPVIVRLFTGTAIHKVIYWYYMTALMFDSTPDILIFWSFVFFLFSSHRVISRLMFTLLFFPMMPLMRPLTQGQY